MLGFSFLPIENSGGGLLLRVLIFFMFLIDKKAIVDICPIYVFALCVKIKTITLY